MTDPVFGISFKRDNSDPRPAIGAEMSVIALVGTAPAALADTFPLNTAVLFNSDDTVKLTSLGTTGTLPPQFELINGQLGEFQASARVMVVRVEQGVDEAATMANIIGSSALGTGIHALKMAGASLGLIPRLVGVPGFTYQRDSGLAALTLTSQGSDLTEAPTVGFTGGGADPDKLLPTAHAVLGSGATAGKVVSLVIDTPGKNLIAPITVTFAGGGTDPDKALPTASATVEDLANSVCAALPPVLNSLLAHAVVTGPHSSYTAYQEWRETLNSDRLIPVETWAKNGNPASDVDSVGSILGVGVRRDHEFGGRPFHSWANQPIYGIVGPNRHIPFSLTDGATEGQQILAANGGIIVRGETGVETAAASGGFIFIGTDNAGEDDLWRFYNVTRGRDYIHLLLLKTLRFYLGRFNLTGQTIQSVINTMNFALRDLKAEGDILGYEVGFTRDQNSPENLRMGRFSITFKAEEAPVLRHLSLTSTRYRPALDALLGDLLSQLDAVA